MPGAGTKQQQISEPTPAIAPTGDPQLTPSAVLSDFGQMCVALPASGALIAVRDLAGLRCTVSFGNAPAVGSRLPTDSAFIRQVFESGEVALSEDATSERANFRSAVAVPILAQGSVAGLIAIFSCQPSAFSPTAIAGLQQIAKSFAALLIFDAANDGQPVIGGPLDHPIVLPKLAADQPPPATADPAAEAPEQTPTATLVENSAIVETFEKPTLIDMVETPAAVELIEKPRTHEIPAPTPTRPIATTRPATLAQLPSDRPTPTRVWLIAAVLLVALSLLFLFLFETASRKQDASLDAITNVEGVSLSLWNRL